MALITHEQARKSMARRQDKIELNGDMELDKKKCYHCNEHEKMNNLPETSFGQLTLLQALQSSSSLDERERSLHQWINGGMGR